MASLAEGSTSRVWVWACERGPEVLPGCREDVGLLGEDELGACRVLMQLAARKPEC